MAGCRVHSTAIPCNKIAASASITGANQVRAGDQPQDRQGARPRSATDAARPRRRGDRVSAKLKRREFITLLGGAVAMWPIAAGAQQPGMPVIGFLHPGFPEAGSPAFDALRAGLRDAGYVEGNTFKLEARWARGRPELLRQFAQDLVQLRVDLIVATARPSIEAARAVTTELQTISKVIR